MSFVSINKLGYVFLILNVFRVSSQSASARLSTTCLQLNRTHCLKSNFVVDMKGQIEKKVRG